jgi:hypothetical protein
MPDATIKNSEIYEASLVAVRNIIFNLIPSRDDHQPYFPDLISTPDEFRDEVVKLGTQYVPACGLRIETMRKYNDSRNKQSLTHLRGLSRYPDRTRTQHNLSCIQTDLNAYYYDDDMTSMKQFMKNWLYQQEYSLNLVNDDIAIGCHLSLGDSITVPQRSFGQAGNLYDVESGIILTSYVGTVKRISLLKQINTSVNLLGFQQPVTYTLYGNGTPTLSAQLIGIGYWDKLNAVGYVAVSMGNGSDDWQKVPAPEIITDWEIKTNIAGDGTRTISRVAVSSS